MGMFSKASETSSNRFVIVGGSAQREAEAARVALAAKVKADLDRERDEARQAAPAPRSAVGRRRGDRGRR